ncbi:MAG: transposase [Phycisphaeraceae bacterium]|nr:MAG: transposase [Phycisphaeraceae bacterium]
MPDDRRERTQRFLSLSDIPCPSCGYNLRGLGEGACPECGAAIDLDRALENIHRRRPAAWWIGVVGAGTGAPLTVLGACLFPFTLVRLAPNEIIGWLLLAFAFVLVSLEWVLLLALIDRRRLVDRMAPKWRWTIASFTWWPHAALFLMVIGVV